ncbi:AfsR/SARP family transcriptional regulator [Saccharothrix sp. Mg75]|uniref:AfsR/SARP family transcriptional regulator n=1 Tax=Saccharothrix sp. Mg75 TaxID=3445357 RepID=UPI003EEB4C4A
MALKSVRIQVLGSLRAWHDRDELDLGPPGRRAVLGLLVLAGGEAVTTRELVDALWGDRPPRSALNVLQTHVKHLRRLLEPDRPPRAGSGVLPHVGGGYAVRVHVVDVDLLHVRRLVAEAQDAHRDGDTARVASLLGEALRWWRGRPLANVPVLAKHPGVLALVAERRELLARYGDAMIQVGAAAEVLPEVAADVAEQPLDEPAQARLIRAYHAVGQRARAFQVYHEVRDRLVEELGVDPGPELVAAHAALLRDDPVTGSGPARAGPAVGGPAPRAPRAPGQLPADPGGFTGRAAALSELDALLPAGGGAAGGGAADGEANGGGAAGREQGGEQGGEADGGGPGGAVRVVAISGTAGVGKTALAVHWAHRVRDRFPDGQLYANLRGHAHGPPATPIEVLARFLVALGVPAERVPVDVGGASDLYRSLLTDRKVLVLLDNAADPDQVRPLLSAAPGCLVVVTGRDRLGGLVAVHGARPLTLGVLGRADALELLTRVLGERRVRAEPGAAVELVELCVHLPLALRIAAADLAEHPGAGIADHVAELRAGNLLAALAMRGDEQAAVRTAFDLSCAALPPAARRLFRLLSLVPGADVGTEAVAALADVTPERAARLLDRLAGAHLVEHHAPGRHRFHDLLRRYAAEQAERWEPAEERAAALRRLHDWHLNAVDVAAGLLSSHLLRLPVPPTGARTPSGLTDGVGAAYWLDAELGNLVAVVRHAARAGPRRVAWLLADSLRGYFWMSTRRVEWLAVAEAGLAAAEGADEPRAPAAARLSLADLHFRQGRYRQAVRHHAHGLLLSRRAGWVEGEAAVLGNLGCVYWQAGRLTAAAARFDRALALSRGIGQPAGEAAALGNLGLVHWEMGRLARAAEHYARALSRYRRIGSRHGEAINLANLGQVQRVRGLPTEAAELLSSALDLHHEAGDRGSEAEAHGRLAVTCCDLDLPAEALEHARAGLALAREAGDPRTEAEALTALATVHRRLGHRPDAVRRYRQALDLIRETGDRYPEVDALIGLATATAGIGDARHALALARHAGYRALVGQAMGVLADIRLLQDHPGDAAEHARQALAVHRETGHRLGEAQALAVLRRASRRATAGP